MQHPIHVFIDAFYAHLMLQQFTLNLHDGCGTICTYVNGDLQMRSCADGYALRLTPFCKLKVGQPKCARVIVHAIVK